MKSSELRIGNYVRLKDTGEIVRVCGLTEDRVYYGDMNVSRYDNVEGVPIRAVYFKLPGIAALTWDDRTEDIYRYGHGSATYDYICIKYLHELQNIHYALTGNEIEIEI